MCVPRIEGSNSLLARSNRAAAQPQWPDLEVASNCRGSQRLQFFENVSHQNHHPLISGRDNAHMFRILAMLSGTVSADLYLFAGKYTHAIWLIALWILRPF
jgi:hypothetical protein